jgi:hypothetical protein
VHSTRHFGFFTQTPLKTSAWLIAESTIQKPGIHTFGVGLSAAWLPKKSGVPEWPSVI